MSIVARGLVKQYEATRAVSDVSFEIAPGEIVGLIGPNGAGKTTILRMLATFIRPTAGTVHVAGFDGATDAVEVRRRIGYLPEMLPGHPDVRVDEYLQFRARLKDVPRRERPAEIDRCLASCQLTPVRRRLIGRLSQGYRRRVGLADVLLNDPPVLLLDEPTIGLDPLQVLHTRELLAGMAHDRVILLSTHLLAEAEALCHRALMLVRGRLRSDVNLDELRHASAFEVEIRGPSGTVEQALRLMPQAQSVVRLKGDGLPDAAETWTRFRVQCLPGADLREQVVGVCHRSGWSLRELSSTARSLEEHFVRIALTVEREAA